MKKIVLASLMMVCLPYWAMSQSVDDDLYFIPKKKAEKKLIQIRDEFKNKLFCVSVSSKYTEDI